MSITLTATDSLRLLLITSTNSSLDVMASYAEITSGGIVGKNKLLNISSATTTEIFGVTPAGTQIAIKEITARNIGNSLNTAKFVIAPYNKLAFNAVLNPGDMVEWSENVGWRLINSAGTPVDLIADTPIDTQIFDTPGTFTWKKPTTFRPKMIKITMWGGGGGGGGGRGAATGPKRGGTGGGGGAFNETMFLADEVPDEVTVIVGAGGQGGAGGTDTFSTGSYGAVGGYSRFGEFIMAGGGGGGAGGDVASTVGGGGGGGRYGQGMSGVDNNIMVVVGGPFASFGGYPGPVVQYDGVSGQGGSALGGGAGNHAEFGGAGGGGQTTAGVTYVGGSSIHGGGGGGCGGSTNATGTTITQPSAGGRNDGIWGTVAGGGAAGTSGIVSTPGFDGSAGAGRRGGAGGGGGGSSVTAGMTGKHGGNGGARGGGGGGGGGATSSSDPQIGGDGGNGGRGEVIVTVW